MPIEISPPKIEGETVLVKRVNWRVTRQGYHQCGDIQLRPVGERPYGRQRWGIFVKRGGRWVRCYAKSRPYSYGDPGSIKVGLGNVKTLVIGDPTGFKSGESR
ncbi:hypothetical protein KOR42_23530 [Thalassoglobus neptunius]|uniref:Uncharacterized protein n=1 Tax=Thalassoglobus neptunius TaxID=1938619 RepID=A0A5C5X7E2_9PLAN|nr:hypothetical protein [Thalassoglobus neptunius]TWT58966.1 hypothetical protein KOR42_23530 [Thalassoglobus neptunius]